MSDETVRPSAGDDRAGVEETLGFAEAMGELEAILGRIEAEEVDIDHLARELERASELLELCRGKIRKAEVEIHQIVNQLGDQED